MSTPEDRAVYIVGMRRLMDILEADPALPLPEMHDRQNQPVTFWLPVASGRTARQMLAALESAIEIPLTGRIDDEGRYYLLEGDLDGMKIRIKAWADDVAERRVTGTRTVEDVEWVRLPAENPAEATADAEEPQS